MFLHSTQKCKTLSPAEVLTDNLCSGGLFEMKGGRSCGLLEIQGQSVRPQQVVASVSHYCTHCTSIAPVRLSHRSGRISEVFSTEFRQTSANGVPPSISQGRRRDEAI